MVDNLINAMEHAIQEVKQWPEKTVQVFHHNDSDGLSFGRHPHPRIGKAGI